MPKKSQKSKSKRMTLKQKYKIKKKVKEHVRKKKKQEKKLGIKPKGPKDPGLPSQWPFKEELIKEFAFKRAQILADEKQKKEERKARQRAAANGDGDEAMEGGEGEEGEEQALLRLQATVTNKQEDFETRKRARLTADFQSDKDNSKKAFYKEFKKVVELADVVIQVLDARDPLACRCPDVETYIRSTNPNKRIVLLLNKMDLVPREVGEQWLKYFREELPTVAFKCNTQQQADKLGRKKMPKSKRAALEAGAGGLQSSNCLGADTLIQLLKNYCRNTGIKTSITVGVVGLPNVGKSSLINSLKRARVAQVGNTPGVTKSVQEVHLDKNIKLLDSPGIVFAAAEDDSSAVLRNCVKIERLRDPAGPVVEILKRVPPKPLMALYKVGVWETADQFLQQVAQTRGKLRKGGVPDMQATAKVVLQDWYDGRIPYFTRPPSRGNEAFASAEVVASWASEFDAEQVFANEQSAVIAHLPPMDGEDGAEGAAGAGAKGGRQFFQLESMGGAKVDLESMDADDDAEEDGGDMEHDGDQEDEDGSTYGLPAKKARAGAVAPAAILYGEEGQFNPHAARAEKKKAKKGDKEAAVAAAVAAKAAKGPKGAKGKEEDNEDFELSGDSPLIPSLPISAADAEVILKSIVGDVADGDVYPVGPGQGILNLSYIGETVIARIENVIGVIEGEEEPDRYVILGNHRDAWSFGAVDPNSGTAVLLEIAQRLDKLQRRGWKPRRTIIFCNWDAEEYALIGSTEWVEENREMLASRAVAYLNVDCAVSGPGFRASATPQLDELIKQAAQEVQDPDNTTQTVYDSWIGSSNSGVIGRLGDLTSDYASFVQHVGVPAADMRFGGGYPVYHSMYDDFTWMEKFGDPMFQRHVAMASVLGLVALRLADEEVLPFNYVSYATELMKSAEDLEKDNLGHGIDVSPLFKSIQDLYTSAQGIHIEKEGIKGALKARELNDRLMMAERALTDRDGLSGRTWYKHLVYGPAKYDEYGSESFPGIDDAIDNAKRVKTKNYWGLVQHEIWRVSRAITHASLVLKGVLR